VSKATGCRVHLSSAFVDAMLSDGSGYQAAKQTSVSRLRIGGLA
jgi:hypothetical protein